MFELSLWVYALVVALSLPLAMSLFGRNHFQVSGKHVYIAGASEGLGLALANLLVQRKAHVTIVSRSQTKLDKALESLSLVRLNQEQQIQAIAADLTDPQHASDAFEKACNSQAGIPEVVFTCVGGAGNGILGLFTELDQSKISQAMDWNYLTAAYTSHAAAKKMAQNKIRGKIIFVSSVAALVGFAGYSIYTPAKMAVRGLAEVLRNELLLYDISVHCYFPATIDSPGLVEENKTKPAITKEIEGVDEAQSPETCAAKLVKGLESNHTYITSDILGDLFRNSMRGIVKPNYWLLDPLLWLIAPIVAIIWRPIVDGMVRKHAKRLGSP